MRRSTRRPNSIGGAGRNRIIAVVGTLVVFAGIITVTQISSAQDRKPSRTKAAASAQCVTPSPGATATSGRTVTRTWQNGRWVRNHWGDGQLTAAECKQLLAGGAKAVNDGVPTVDCPDVAGKLGQVPDQAKAEVDRNLEQLRSQISEANRKLASIRNTGDQALIDNTILRPLADKRKAAIDRIAIAIDRVGDRPQGLDQLSACKLAAAPTGNDGEVREGEEGDNNNEDGNNEDGNNEDGNNEDGNNEDGNNEDGNNEEDGDNNEGQDNNGLDVLAQNCDNSDLQPHDGFQAGNRCVSTAFGEVGAADKNASLLIVDFPEDGVAAGEDFTIRVSTRNLVRDRFLGAAAGGYYLESSVLNDQGLTRGHFHTACRILPNENEAPDPSPAPAFFVATEDGAGGAQPDTVDINVPGIDQEGTVQCASWAGDGSHRIPMMERANQTPAFDAVRFQIN